VKDKEYLCFIELPRGRDEFRKPHRFLSFA
jgi:hypothetical protein